MAAALKLQPVENDVLALADQDVTEFLTDKEARRDFLDQVRKVALTAGDDVSTAKSREAIISTAAKVTRAKTTIDNAGKEMTEEWREKVNAVNAARKEVRDDLTLLAAEVRRPVSEWEQVEADRKVRADEILHVLRETCQRPIPLGDPSAEGFAALLDRTRTMELPEDVLGDDLAFAASLRDKAVSAIEAATAEFEKAEADRAELEALRREKAEREAREEEERRQREEQAAAKARAEQEAAEAKAREEAQRRAAEEAERLAEERAAEAAEKARQDERDRIEAEQRKQREAEEKVNAEAERKARNVRHRARIRAEVAETLETRFELDGARANAIAAAIANGSIPHTSIQF